MAAEAKVQIDKRKSRDLRCRYRHGLLPILLPRACAAPKNLSPDCQDPRDRGWYLITRKYSLQCDALRFDALKYGSNQGAWGDYGITLARVAGEHDFLAPSPRNDAGKILLAYLENGSNTLTGIFRKKKWRHGVRVQMALGFHERMTAKYNAILSCRPIDSAECVYITLILQRPTTIGAVDFQRDPAEWSCVTQTISMNWLAGIERDFHSGVLLKGWFEMYGGGRSRGGGALRLLERVSGGGIYKSSVNLVERCGEKGVRSTADGGARRNWVRKYSRVSKEVCGEGWSVFSGAVVRTGSDMRLTTTTRCGCQDASITAQVLGRVIASPALQQIGSLGIMSPLRPSITSQ
ncbi:hypothetical protein V8E55_009273 [Tylopilus felleus]